MTIREILKMGDPRLLRIAQPVKAFDTPQLHALVADLFDTMHAASGAGLAAPQIGVDLQLVIFGFSRNERYPDAPIGHAIRRGLTPITLGLVFASATILMRTVNHDWRGYLITLLTVAVVLRKSWNPLWLFTGGALAGILGFV